MKLFHGETVVVLASGPSLTEDDIKAVGGFKKIAVNTTWEKVRDCDVLFAGDNKWWIHNADKVDIPARRVSLNQNSERQFKAKRFKSKVTKKGGYNSGCIAIEYAVAQGASKVILLGFDCSVENGTHHHGDHKTSPNPNKRRCMMWQKQFKTLREMYPKADIVNCSRYTEIHSFPKRPLETVLCELS